MLMPGFWYNGELRQGNTLALAIDDPGLLYGATVFTTLRVYEGSLDLPLTNWTGHCDRIRQTLNAFGWPQPNWPQLRQGAELLAADFPILRVTIFPDGREWIVGRQLPAHLARWQQQGIVAWLAKASPFRRSLAAHKTGNYLPAWLAAQTAREQAAEAAILLDRHDCWLETSTGNLWGWQEGHWWTPPLDGNILPGLARSQLIQWLMRHNKTIGETPWTPERVQRFEVVAMTNSAVEVVPIHTVLLKNTALDTTALDTTALDIAALDSAAALTYDPHHPALEILRAHFQP